MYFSLFLKFLYLSKTTIMPNMYIQLAIKPKLVSGPYESNIPFSFTMVTSNKRAKMYIIIFVRIIIFFIN